MNYGNFIEYLATDGHPAAVPGWAQFIAWPVLIIAFILARPNNG